ncbi:MAG: hypothetical protein EOO34_00160 [Cyanobacteriota bacterium]|nr:MAG: hypothetical protein EOO34_00160 [Cyanobacteriota bacterium]
MFMKECEPTKALLLIDISWLTNLNKPITNLLFLLGLLEICYPKEIYEMLEANPITKSRAFVSPNQNVK